VIEWPRPLALNPRRPGKRVTHAESLRLLEGERMIVSALAIRALVEAWDTGRINATTEGLPREREILGLLGVAQGLAGARVQEANEQVTQVIGAARALELEIEGIRPLGELGDEFALSSLARKILVMVAAPQLWGELAQLYGIVTSASGRAICDEHLLRLLLGDHVNPHDLAHELLPTQPLRGLGLIHATSDEPAPFTGFAPDPIVLARMRAEPLDEDPANELLILPWGKPVTELRIPEPIARQISAAISHRPAHPLRVVVRGRDGSGRRTLLASLAALANRRIAIINLHHLGETGRLAMPDLRRALERCALAGWMPCIDGLDSVAADDRAMREKLRRTLGAYPGPLGLRLEKEASPPIEPGYLLVDIPDLNETERLEVWRTELAHKGIAVGDTLGPLTSRWRIGAGTIHRVVEHVTEGGNTQISSQQIDAAVSQHLERKLGDVAEKIRYLPSLADMVLPPDIMDSMTEFLSRMKMHRQVFEDWGMTKVASTGRGITALFQGPPGTGKTMVAGALARELGIELYRVDLSRVMSKWIGETERNLGNVFSAAEESQAIILFDEADSLFGKRTEVKSSNDRFANLEVNYLLQRLDTFFGIAILTTNLGTSIDPAFKRRLSFRVHFPVPDEEQREQLWRAHLPPTLPTAGDLDLEDLAHKYPLTGGSVRNCVMRAAFLAAAENAKLSQVHLLRAVRLEYRAAGKLSESGPLE
jgi:ATPase family associated with various cellular activities (AAA)